MPALSQQNWNLVQTASPIVRLQANWQALDVRKRLDLIGEALRRNNLLDNEAVANVAIRLNVDIGALSAWKIIKASHERNNRYEVDICREFQQNLQFYTGFEKSITLHCSTRHLKDNYYIAYSDSTPPGAALSTIAYCSASEFLEAMNEFAQKMCDALNAHAGGGAFNPRNLPNYIPASGPRFESDAGPGTSCHCYPVDTPGSAITLTAGQHNSMKKVLRGVYAPKAVGSANVEAHNEWAVIRNDAAIHFMVPAYERNMFDKALGF